MIDGLFRDARYAVRNLRRAPGVAAAIIATLALAIGANTAAFSLVNAIVLRTMPVKNPDRLVLLQAMDQRGQAPRSIYYSSFAALQQLPVFESLALYSGGGGFQIDVRGGRSEGLIEASTPGLFETLGIEPHLGRFFTTVDAPADGPPAPVVVLSHDFWQRTFKGDPTALGEVIAIDGKPVTVIGVTPPHYKGFHVDGGYGFSVPLTFLNRVLGSDPKRPIRGLNAIGRLAPGVSLESASAAVQTVWPAIRVETVPPGVNPTEQKEIPTQRMTMESLSTGISSLRRQYREPLLVVSGITALLLLIGCVNVSGLLLTRTASRQRQFALQLALGASRARLLRQLLVESLLLCVIGTAVAIVVAWWATLAAGRVLSQASVPLVQTLTPDVRVLAFSVLVACAVTILVTLVPARAAGQRHAREALTSSRTATGTSRRWTKGLLVMQVAVSLVLLVGASLLTASLEQLRNLDIGVRSEGLRWSRLFAVPNGFRNQNEITYYPELVRQLSAVPNVQSVALATAFPTAFALDLTASSLRVTPAGGPEGPESQMERITPRFFETAGIPLLQGRDFTWRDDRQHPAVAIINESVRRKIFPNGYAIGQRISIGTDPSRSSVEVVGVVADSVMGGYKNPNFPVVFRPRMQDALSPRSPVLLLRTSGQAAEVDAAVSKVIDGLGQEYPRRFHSLDEQIDIALVRERLLATLSSFFAALAVLLAFVGLYSALAFAVAGRTRELGVRMAVGATRAHLVSMVVRESAVVTIAGVIIGVPAAIATGRFIDSWLFGIGAADPFTIVAASVFFVFVGIAAAARPAQRASQVDPAVALRAE